MAGSHKKIPFDFVLDTLLPLSPRVRPMFGCYAVYIADKIVFILRDRNNEQHDNGVWLATRPEYHESLKRDFASLRSIRLLGSGESKWQNIPMDAEDFEESVLKACEMVLNGDERIGKIPNT